MQSKKPLLERALEIANTGQFDTSAGVRRALEREGYDTGPLHGPGTSLVKQALLDYAQKALSTGQSVHLSEVKPRRRRLAGQGSVGVGAITKRSRALSPLAK